MAEFALSAVLVEFNVFKMTEVTGGLRDLEFLLIGFVLVARGAAKTETSGGDASARL